MTLDYNGEQRKKRESMQRAARHADAALLERAEEAAIRVLERDGDVDSTRARLELRARAGRDFAEPRAWGSVLKRVARRRGLRRIRYREAGSHGRPVAVWGRA